MISAIHSLIELLLPYGYIGIFFMMFLESSFVPFPSELVMPPAGFLSASGQLNLELSIISGTAGSIAGALFNYAISIKLGRPFLIKYGRYVGFKTEHLVRSEKFFDKYGSIGTFIGRLLPVIRQYISIPAGISKMNLTKFIIATGLGAGLWVSVLALLGYILQSKWNTVVTNINTILITIVLLLSAASVVYLLIRRHNNREKR
ncbi:MAG: membrane protein [bacterium]|nr:MAG: membrane protein [bacterium]